MTFQNNKPNYKEFTDFIKLHAPFTYVRRKFESEDKAHLYSKVIASVGISLSPTKDNCHVLRFNKHNDRKGAMPALQICWFDFDNPEVITHTGNRDWESFRKWLLDQTKHLNLPIIVLATPSGKAKMGVAVKFNSGEDAVATSASEMIEIVNELATVIGIDDLTKYLDTCWSGISVLCLTSNMEVIGTHNLHSCPWDARPTLKKLAWDAVSELKFSMSFTSKTLSALPADLTEKEVELLELIAAFKISNPDTEVALSQAAIAKTMEVNPSTVSRLLTKLEGRNLIKKASQGNQVKGCSTYTLSWMLIKAIQRSLEKTGRKEQRIQQVRQWTHTTLGPATQATGEEGLAAALVWLNEHAALVEGQRFRNVPAWSGTLYKLGCDIEETVSIILENDFGHSLDRAEVRRWVSSLRRRDAQQTTAA